MIYTTPHHTAPQDRFKVNFHYILKATGNVPNNPKYFNFTEYGDGNGGSLNGYQRAEQIVAEANRQTEANTQVWGSPPFPAVCPLNFKIA